MKAACWMHGRVLAVNATAKMPNLNVWADEVRLMREIDGRTHKEICELFQWAKHDAFWCANIQSPGKLRAKWDTLVEQQARPKGAGRGPGTDKRFFFDSGAAAKTVEPKPANFDPGFTPGEQINF